MKKKLITVFLTVLVFLSAVTLGVSTVFRVDTVTVKVTAVSERAQTEAAQLKAELEGLYKSESIFSVDSSKLNKAITGYPYFRVTGFVKYYPNKILVSITEDAEVYAVERAAGGYYVLGRDGSILEIREGAENRLDGANNVVLKKLNVQGERGGVLTGDDCYPAMLTLCQSMDGALGGIRRNVLSVEVLYREPETFYLITMKEGVKIYVGNPSALTEQKAVAAVNEYLSLSDAERMTGRITVREDDGKVLVAYSPQDELGG